jgi:acetyl esterase/lipase
MTRSVETAAPPILFFQAENDVSIAPSRTLFAARQAAGRPAELRIYPAFGHTAGAGHSFPYRGVDIWQKDVLNFLDRHCQEGDPETSSTSGPTSLAR